MRWQNLAINLEGSNVQKRILFYRVILILIFVFMIFSSFVMKYPLFSNEWVSFAMGNFINSYAINISIVLFYVLSYVKLSNYYKDL